MIASHLQQQEYITFFLFLMLIKTINFYTPEGLQNSNTKENTAEIDCGFASLQFKGVRLSRNYRLIGSPRKFDVLKTNIWPRSNAQLRGQKRLVLRTNFQNET